MGFNSVYRSLVEIFPQVDKRLLRAVAIEHAKDADAAVNSIISEIFPYLSERGPETPPADTSPMPKVDEQVELDADQEEEGNLLRRRTVVGEKEVGSSSGETSMAGLVYDNNVSSAAYISGQASTTSGGEEVILLGNNAQGNSHNTGSLSNNSFHGKSTTDNIGEEVILLKNVQENGQQSGSICTSILNLTSKDGENADSAALQDKDGVNDAQIDVNYKVADAKNLLDDYLTSENFGENVHGESVLVDTQVEGLNHVTESQSTLQEQNKDTFCSSPHLDNASAKNLIDDFEELPDIDNYVICKTEEEEHDDATLNTIVSQSGQICRLDLLDEIVEAAKTNKKTLFAAMESVISMMREVELQEKAAEAAREESASGALEIYAEVEKLKAMLTHAKETNSMHSGEVYGEKAILATEVRELQTRLLILSEERDKSLAILDEMRQSLEARLAVAEELRKAAELEKLEKEDAALNALADQKAVMEKVVQESETLQQEAEENTKLREFLMDRGHVVDTLQGEISVIIKDIRSLKENFDGRVPLSQSISSSQTSCILASSGSSTKSITASDPLADQNARANGSWASSVDSHSPRSCREEESRTPLTDDEWDLLDKDAELKEN